LPRPVAIITGASSGIGMVYAQRLAANHDLVLVARRKDRLEALTAELAARHGSKIEVLTADLTDEHDLAVVADRIAAETNLALLVNNAGFGALGIFWEADLEAQLQMHRLHVMATVHLSHAALKNMVPRNTGGIINVASVAAFVRRAGSIGYGSTKTWMTAFTEGLYLELKSKQSGVKVQALCPGFTYTEFHEVAQVERKDMAGESLWLTAEHVVDDSLKALPQGKLFVVPGWRYKAIVAVLTKLPTSLRLRVESATRRR
jgi:short-subunit dehydrogenase